MREAQPYDATLEAYSEYDPEVLANPYPLYHQQAREQSLHFATRLLEGMLEQPLFERLYRLGLAEEKDEDRLRLAHVEVLGRPATAEELAQAANFLSEYAERLTSAGQSEEGSRLAAWQSYCQSLFCLNEFLYID